MSASRTWRGSLPGVVLAVSLHPFVLLFSVGAFLDYLLLLDEPVFRSVFLKVSP